MRAVRAVSGLWRWRRNPLRRATDLAEAWLALTALLLVALAAPLIGVLSGSAAHTTLQRSIRAQHQSRHLVTATVVRELDAAPAATDPELLGGDAGSRVLARWTAPDGTGRRAAVQARVPDPRPGDTFRIWTDRRGDRVARPLDTGTATVHAVLAGAGAALLAAGLFEAGRRLVLRRMLRGRYARWDREWGRVGPDWGRADAAG
ncbi:Rv1733c family protein [Streptomyces pseudogriseolus]|uniref:Rv1733c family protein n=1 Tax=Streptomyces pseudogriseolus TaxID=36817 RepID=UPI003FA1ABC4